MTPLRYCISFGITVATLVALVSAANLLLDPFAMFRWVEIGGVNAYKPAIHTRVRLLKAYEIERVRPQTIVVGSSRTHVGIRCSHPGITALPGPCYNAAFDGATTREMLAYIQHAHAVRPLKVVLLGLDAYHLTTGMSFTRPDFDPSVLYAPARPRIERHIAGTLRLLASLSTLSAGIDMLRRQDAVEPEWFAPDGQRLGEVFFHRDGEEYVAAGPRAYFDAVDRLEVGYQTEGVSTPPVPMPLPPLPTGPVPEPPSGSSIDYVARIVEFCRTEGIDLRIFVTPAHVHQSEIATATGAWPGLAQGKRALAALLAKSSDAGQSRSPLVAWDFGLYSAVTEEPLPPIGSSVEMAYYWDSSHFKEIVGDYVLDRLVPRPERTPGGPDGFGERVAWTRVDEVLAKQRELQLAYRARFPDEVASLRVAVAEAVEQNRRKLAPSR